MAEADATERPAEEPNRTEENGLESVWKRWDGEKATALHKLCALYPVDSLYEEADGPGLQIVDRGTRLVLRHAPLTVLITTIVFFVAPLVEPNGHSLGTLLFEMDQFRLLWSALFTLLSGALIWILSKVAPGTLDEFWKGLLLYGTMAFLFGCWLISLMYFLDLGSCYGAPADSNCYNVVFTAGFLFALLWAGLLAYDATLRMEHFFWHLGETDIISDEDAYDEFKEDLAEDMNRKTLRFVPTAHVFAVILVGLFTLVWLVGRGPQGLDMWATLVGNVVFDFIIMVYLFQFILILKRFHPLLTDGYETDSEGVGKAKTEYLPFHPDGLGGFADIGRVAMRVNNLFVLGGLYYVYRVYVVGGRLVPEGGLVGFETATLYKWLFNYIGPVGIYAVVVGVWLYYTFWEMHKRMLRGKRDKIAEFQEWKRKKEDETVEDPDRPAWMVEGLDDDATWNTLQSAPEWPISDRRLYVMLVADVIPILLAFPKFL